MSSKQAPKPHNDPIFKKSDPLDKLFCMKEAKKFSRIEGNRMFINHKVFQRLMPVDFLYIQNVASHYINFTIIIEE